MDKILQIRKKEQGKLNVLQEKRQKLDEKIKESEAKIVKYTLMINQRKFSEVTDVLNVKGLSLEEVMTAIKNGDLLSLQEKITDMVNGTKSEGNDGAV